jgi:hypothetical protein
MAESSSSFVLLHRLRAAGEWMLGEWIVRSRLSAAGEDESEDEDGARCMRGSAQLGRDEGSESPGLVASHMYCRMSCGRDGEDTIRSSISNPQSCSTSSKIFIWSTSRVPLCGTLVVEMEVPFKSLYQKPPATTTTQATSALPSTPTSLLRRNVNRSSVEEEEAPEEASSWSPIRDV